MQTKKRKEETRERNKKIKSNVTWRENEDTVVEKGSWVTLCQIIKQQVSSKKKSKCFAANWKTTTIIKQKQEAR